MFRLSTFAFAVLITALAKGQTSNLIIFSEMGEKFTLIVDGEVKNEVPATRVVATGLKSATPSILVKFADAGIPPVKQNAWLEPDMEYTLKLTTNKKWEHVLRMQGQAALGTSTSTSTFVEDPPATISDPAIADPPAPSAPQGTGGTGSVTTTTTQSTGTTGAVNMNVGINGVGVNMSVGITDPLAATTTTTTTTTMTTTTTTTTGQNDETDQESASTPVVEEVVQRMPGYNGPIGCMSLPMGETDFNEAKATIESKGFEETKLTVAKQIGDNNCFSVAQVKAVMGLFGFEETRLDFAKYAYDHTHDIGNYYKVNDAFSFSSSIDELSTYLKSR